MEAGTVIVSVCLLRTEVLSSNRALMILLPVTLHSSDLRTATRTSFSPNLKRSSLGDPLAALIFF